MKIVKGHYVPKELITSEALHEAVVKCFVAAGFIDDGRGKYKDSSSWNGLRVDDSGFICWSLGPANNLTLQQLFTAENGISWPDWAADIRLSAIKEVCFTDGKSRALRFGEESTFSMMFGSWHWPIIAEKPNQTQAQSLTHSEEGLMHSDTKDLSDLSFAISDAVSMAVDAGANDVAHKLQEISKSVLAMQKDNLERKKVIDCAAERVGGIVDMEPLLNELYDAGMLVMPK